MIISNFIYRIRQYAGENRARLVKFFLLVAGAILGAFLIYAGIERALAKHQPMEIQNEN